MFVALIVTAVVTAVAMLEVRSSERAIDRELGDAARLTAQSVAENLSIRQEPPDPLDVRDTLHDLIAADPVIDAIAVIQVDESGRPRVLTSTSTEERAEVLDLAMRAIATGAAATERSDVITTFALPVARRGSFAVVVTVGLNSLVQARARGVRIAFGLALPIIVLVTILVHLTVRRFDIIDRAFEPWVTTKPVGQGSGIGLAIVRDVVRAHGGTVSAHNRPKGAAIVIDLPAAGMRERLSQS